MHPDAYIRLLEGRIRLLIITLLLFTPFLRLVLPLLTISGEAVLPLSYMLPFIALIPIVLHFRFMDKFRPNNAPDKSIVLYLGMLFLLILITLMIFAAFGIPVKGRPWQSRLGAYLYLFVTQAKGFSVIVLMVKIASSQKLIAHSRTALFFILLCASFAIDASTGVRSLLMNFYILPFIFYVFVIKGVSASFRRFLVVLPAAIVIFYVTNRADQDLLETLTRFDMSTPLDFSMRVNPESVLTPYLLQNTYFPNMIRPILSMFLNMPDVNPGAEISNALGFESDLVSYYAISVFGEAFLNFGNGSALGYLAVTGVFLVYVWIISICRFFRPFDVQIALIITLTSTLIVHGFEDYFAVRFLAAVKILLIAAVMNRFINMTSVSIFTRVGRKSH